MDKLDPFIFGCLVFGGGAAMMALHWDKNFKHKFRDLSEDETRFHRKQYYRRMITSGMITTVGILFMVYRFLPPKSIVRVWLIAVVLLLVGLILVFAMLDFHSVGRLFKLERKQTASATEKLADELNRIRREKQEQEKADGDSDSANSAED